MSLDPYIGNIKFFLEQKEWQSRILVKGRLKIKVCSPQSISLTSYQFEQGVWQENWTGPFQHRWKVDRRDGWHILKRKLMSLSYRQEFGPSYLASNWLSMSCVANQEPACVLTQLLTMSTTHKFPSLDKGAARRISRSLLNIGWLRGLLLPIQSQAIN